MPCHVTVEVIVINYVTDKTCPITALTLCNIQHSWKHLVMRISRTDVDHVLSVPTVSRNHKHSYACTTKANIQNTQKLTYCRTTVNANVSIIQICKGR